MKQVRIRLHRGREPGLPAAAAARRGGLRGVRRRRAGERPLCAPSGSHLDSIIQALELASPRQKTDLYPILRNVAESCPRRGLMVLVSDFARRSAGVVPRPAAVAEPRARRHGLSHSRRRRVGFSVQRADAVRGAGVAGAASLQPRALREGYLTAFGAYLEEIRRGCSRHSVDYALLRTSQPLGCRLGRVSEQRLGMHHKNRD